MQINRLNLRNEVVIAICLVGLTVFSGCEKENSAENGLVGKWITSSSHAGESDTIVFAENFYVQQYFDYMFADQIIPALYLAPYVTYSILGSKITFTIHYSYPSVENLDETFEYSLNGNSLTIKGFSDPFSSTFEMRQDVQFTKVN